MNKACKYLLMCAFILFVTTGMTALSYSEMPDKEGKPVTAIQVKNNRAISTETVLSKLKTKVGEKFSEATTNDDLKRLYATEYFTDVSIDVEVRDGGVVVTFIVEEKSVIEDIIFKNNKILTANKLRAAMKSKPNEMLNMALLAQDIAEIKALYTKKGYPSVEVKYSLEVNKELNKAKVIITVDERTRVKVSKITITGNKAIKTGQITKILTTKPAWLFNPGVFNEDALQEDLERIKSLYDEIGYLDTAATPKLNYSADGTVLYITIQIDEGKLYRVGDITIKGDLVLPEKDIRAKIKMKPGSPFSARELRADVFDVKQLYYRYGYINALVDAERNLNRDTGNIDVAYNIDPKEIVYVGKVDVRGNTKTKDIVVRRELRIYPGERYDGEKIRRSKERLYNLGLFEDISFDTEPTSEPAVQDLVVSVKEAKTGEFAFGGGYSSIDYLIGFVEVTQRNFDILNFPTFTGAGQNLAVKAELGMVRNNYNVSWTEPWIFGYPLSFGFDVYRAAHQKKSDIGWAYDETRTGGDLRFGKELTEYLKAGLVYRLEKIRIGDLSDNASRDLRNEEGSNLISSLLFELTQDTRDNVFNPGKGYVAGGTIEDAGGIFFGDKDYVKGTANAAYYHTFFEKFVLEVKGRAGIATSYGDSNEVPIYERFFAGGANTIRGYKERSVSPRDPGSNDPIGGEAIAIGNVEVTFPVYEKVIKGAVFYDVGNTWKDASDFIVGGDYRAGVGVGVRVKTPMGPVNVDYGYPLVGNYDDSRDGEFYFSMSRGF